MDVLVQIKVHCIVLTRVAYIFIAVLKPEVTFQRLNASFFTNENPDQNFLLPCSLECCKYSKQEKKVTGYMYSLIQLALLVISQLIML